MYKNKTLFIIAIILLLIATVASISYPHTYSLGELFFKNAGVTTETESGLRIVNIVIVIILLLSLIAVFFALQKYKWYAIIALFIIFGMPSFGVTIYQKFFAEGIYKIAYNPEKSNCKILGENNISCHLYFLNHSNEPTTTEISFIDMYNSDQMLVNVLSEEGPYTLEIPGKDKDPVQIEAKLTNLSNKELEELNKVLTDEHSYSLHIQIKGEKGVRDL